MRTQYEPPRDPVGDLMKLVDAYALLIGRNAIKSQGKPVDLVLLAEAGKARLDVHKAIEAAMKGNP